MLLILRTMVDVLFVRPPLGYSTAQRSKLCVMCVQSLTGSDWKKFLSTKSQAMWNALSWNSVCLCVFMAFYAVFAARSENYENTFRTFDISRAASQEHILYEGYIYLYITFLRMETDNGRNNSFFSTQRRCGFLGLDIIFGQHNHYRHYRHTSRLCEFQPKPPLLRSTQYRHRLCHFCMIYKHFASTYYMRYKSNNFRFALFRFLLMPSMSADIGPFIYLCVCVLLFSSHAFSVRLKQTYS